MNKEEARVFLKRKLDEGYVTHSMLLGLFRPGEQIPDEYLSVMYHKPLPPKPVLFPIGARAYEEFGKALDDFLKEQKIKNKLI